MENSQCEPETLPESTKVCGPIQPKCGKDEKGDIRAKIKPTHFVAVRITSQEIIEYVDMVQRFAVRQMNDLDAAMIELSKLHLTVMVTKLETEQDIERAKEALNAASIELRAEFNEKLIDFEVEGLTNFGPAILVGKIASGNGYGQLVHIAEVISRCFAEHSVPSTDKRKFNPHVTVMNIYNDDTGYLKDGGITKIPRHIYKNHINRRFGRQIVSKLQLCPMGQEPIDDYYPVIHEVSLTSEKQY